METIAAKRILLALCLCLAAAVVSGVLLLQHHGEQRAVAAVEQACGDAERSGCEAVARSPWSSLGGLPVAALGAFFYLSLSLLLALTLLTPEADRPPVAGLAVAALALALLVDLALLAVQAFAVGAYCGVCILTYFLGAASLLALLPAWRGVPVLGAALRRVEGRLLIAGWALGTLALSLAVLGAEAALDERETRRHLAMLGVPPAAAEPPTAATDTAPGMDEAAAAPAATEAPSSGAPAPSDPTDWERRAKELQETLDDPNKLEEYFAGKARREFEAADVERIDLDNTPFKGPPDAPVKVVEYSDFLCPFCRNLALGLSQFVPQAGGRVAVYFKNFPLDQSCNTRLKNSTHPGACWLALGAVCAHYQGRFEAYHDRVFSADGLRNPESADVVRLAGEAGLNASALESCLQDPATREDLIHQIEEAHRLGVQATPTVYVNGKKLPRINDFVAVVDAEARKKGFEPLAR